MQIRKFTISFYLQMELEGKLRFLNVTSDRFTCSTYHSESVAMLSKKL